MKLFNRQTPDVPAVYIKALEYTLVNSPEFALTGFVNSTKFTIHFNSITKEFVVDSYELANLNLLVDTKSYPEFMQLCQKIFHTIQEKYIAKRFIEQNFSFVNKLK